MKLFHWLQSGQRPSHLEAFLAAFFADEDGLAFRFAHGMSLQDLKGRRQGRPHPLKPSVPLTPTSVGKRGEGKRKGPFFPLTRHTRLRIGLMRFKNRFTLPRCAVFCATLLLVLLTSSYGPDGHDNCHDHSAYHDLKTSHYDYLNDYDRLADYRHDNGHAPHTHHLQLRRRRRQLRPYHRLLHPPQRHPTLR